MPPFQQVAKYYNLGVLAVMSGLESASDNIECINNVVGPLNCDGRVRECMHSTIARPTKEYHQIFCHAVGAHVRRRAAGLPTVAFTWCMCMLIPMVWPSVRLGRR